MKLAVAIMAAFMIIPSGALAQVRVLARDSLGVTVRVESGARMRHLARAIGMEPDMDLIARSNPGHIIYVCYDQLPGERPFMSRDPDSWNACQHFPRERWLLAGVVYRVPLQIEPTAEETTATAESLWREEGLRSRNRELEQRIAELEAELATANEMPHHAALAEEARRERASRESVRGDVFAAHDRSPWYVLIGVLLGLGIAFIAFFFVRRRWVADKGRELEKLAIAIRAEALKSKRKVENALAVMRTKKDELDQELKKLATLYGRRRSRTKLLLVQLAKYRKLLRQSLHAITHFQRQLEEDQARRTQLPELLKQVDQARLHLIYAQNARARSELVAGWAKLLLRGHETQSPTMRRILGMTYRRMLAAYRQERKQALEKAASLEGARTKALDLLQALTGIKIEYLDPEVRLRRSIEAADKNARLLEEQTQALNEIIQAHIRLNGHLDARETGMTARERELEQAEAEIAERLCTLEARERDHASQVDAWHKQLAIRNELDAWSGAALKAETAGKLTEVERRMSEMEGRMNGYERRAVSAEKDLEETNDFLDKVRKEFRAAKELLEGIKKGPNFLEARTAQMAEYISQLEEKLGIERKSIWSGLPDLAYGSIPPKNKA